MYLLVCTNFINVQTSTYQYVQVHTRAYAYILFLAHFKKSANRSRTRNLVHKSPRVYPCAIGLQTLMQVKVRNYVSVYIIWFCQTPCQCNWRLMTNRRCQSRRAAAPSHDIPGPARAWTWILWKPSFAWKLGPGLGTCDVRPADRRSNQKETVP